MAVWLCASAALGQSGAERQPAEAASGAGPAPLNQVQPDVPPNPALEDAQLNDVAFVDDKHGWAVGDRGVIWHTHDGGRHWALQTSGVDCRLAAVEFVSPRHGWAAGGSIKPYTGATTGVLLETRDGGEHWQLDRKLLLPALREIKFFDARRGWAIGQASALFPVSVFTTDDGGRSWSALPADHGQTEGQNWISGDFADPSSGLLAGRSGALASVRRPQVESTADAAFGLRTLARVRIAGPREAWLVGDGGLVRHSTDQGATWQPSSGALPAGEHFDFQALALHEGHCWVAGAPGTQVLHTADAGQTWQSGATAQPLPIRALEFVDERQGWAVGELGLILATADSGQTWQTQHNGGTRAALAGFYARAAEVPLELFARLSGDEGFLGVVEIVNRQDLESRHDERAGLTEATHEAVVRAGGSAASTLWQFPVRESGLRLAAQQLVDDWNQTGEEGAALDRLDAQLVRSLRTWRPAVVVTGSSGRDVDPQTQLITQAVLQAVEHAADPARHREQITAAGLQPWQVDKVFALQPIGDVGSTTLSPAQISPRTGRSLAEVAAAARGMIATQFVPPPTAIGFRLLVDRLPQEVGGRDFFSGIALAASSGARRGLVPVSDDSLQQLKRTAQSRRNLQAILAQAEHQDAQAGRWLAEVGRLTTTLDDAAAAEVLFQLAERYHRQGRWELAAETFEQLATKYPQQPLASAALVWLVQYYASGEAAWRVARHDQIQVQQVQAVQPQRGRPGPTKNPQLPPAREFVGGEALLATHLAEADRRPARAAQFAKQLEQSEAALFAEPRVRFPLAMALRRQESGREAERYLLAQRRTRQHDSWWAAAEVEQWLVTRTGQPPKPATYCPRVVDKPRLDGRLDDAVWQQAQPLELHSAGRNDAEWSSVAMLARDDEFLYLAASCRQPPQMKAAERKKSRKRDADLDTQDRVEFCLDLDRDWTTYYRLRIDERGATHDACWNDATWNPRWFVATDHTDDTWTVEAAIPLSELSGEAPAAGQAWALGVTRVLPGTGLQSWTQPASVEPLGSGFGVLLFD